MSEELTELKEALTSLNLYLRELLLGMKKKNTRTVVYYKEINFSVVWYIKIERKMLDVVNILLKNSIGFMSSIGKKVLHTSGGQALLGMAQFLQCLLLKKS